MDVSSKLIYADGRMILCKLTPYVCHVASLVMMGKTRMKLIPC